MNVKQTLHTNKARRNNFHVIALLISFCTTNPGVFGFSGLAWPWCSIWMVGNFLGGPWAFLGVLQPLEAGQIQQLRQAGSASGAAPATDWALLDGLALPSQSQHPSAQWNPSANQCTYISFLHTSLSFEKNSKRKVKEVKRNSKRRVKEELEGFDVALTKGIVFRISWRFAAILI